MSKTGFTLLEVMISVAIMGMIMVLVWSISSQTLNSKERIEKRDMLFQGGRIALQKLSDDLAMAFLIKQPSIPTGFSPRPKAFFIGEDKGDKDDIRFTSFSHLRFFNGAKQSDQCKVGYEVIPDKEDSSINNLVRRETPWLDAETTVEGYPFVLAQDVDSFELEFYDYRKEEWVNHWDSDNIDFQGKLPSAVRITIAFPDPDMENETISMTTMTLLPMSAGEIDF